MNENHETLADTIIEKPALDLGRPLAAIRASTVLGQVMRALNSGLAQTRTELAEILGFNKSTMTYVVGRLLESGIVEETSQGPASPRGGRKPVRLAIRHDRILSGGIVLEGNRYHAAVIDNAGTVRLRLSDGSPHPRDVSNSLAVAYHHLTDRVQELKLPVVGIGAALSGIVDSRRGRLIRSDALGASDVDLFARLGSRESAEPLLLVDNDANCGAWGELHTNPQAECDFLFGLGRYTGEYLGVGLGIVIDGSVYYGRRFRAGEFASAWSTGSRVNQFGIHSEDLSCARERPEVFRQVLAEFLRSLAPVLAALDPERVVLGGLFRDQIGIVSELLRTELANSFTARVAKEIPFDGSTWGTDELLAGAAGMVIERLFAVPDVDCTTSRHDIVTWDDLFAALERCPWVNT